MATKTFRVTATYRLEQEQDGASPDTVETETHVWKRDVVPAIAALDEVQLEVEEIDWQRDQLSVVVGEIARA